MIHLKTLNKRIDTKSQGVFYKPIVNEQNKEVDKVYLIRWIDKNLSYNDAILNKFANFNKVKI